MEGVGGGEWLWVMIVVGAKEVVELGMFLNGENEGVGADSWRWVVVGGGGGGGGDVFEWRE